ncbi:MAG: hypothetical protein EOO28_16730 [Comamonadaceae bacterium]|nr:MAG: hypothetical protein EOO28_16730 [Comamonadaceae bacterium]
MTTTHVDFSGASMRAMMDALSALTFALARQLNPDQQDGLATDLSRLAKDAQNNGNLELEALLLDMHQKARTGGGAVRPMSLDGTNGAPVKAADFTPTV